MTYTRTSDFILYPNNKVIGIIDDPADCKAALKDLKAAGFTAAEIEVLSGEEGAHRLDPTGEEHGPLARFARWIEKAGDMETEHVRTARTGSAGRSFRHRSYATEPEAREKVREILKAYNGHFINFYGQWAIEGIGTLTPKHKEITNECNTKCSARSLVCTTHVGAVAQQGHSPREVGAQQPETKVNYAPIPSGDYKIDPAHSVIGFAIRHYEISLVRGRFKALLARFVMTRQTFQNHLLNSLLRSRALIPASMLVTRTCAQQTSSTRRNIRR